MERKLSHLERSFKYILFFYFPIFLLVFIFYFSRYYSSDLFTAISIMLLGNVFLALFTQISNYIIEKYAIENKSRDFIYQNFTDCFYRGMAGLLEIIFYTIAFSINLSSLVAGYLLLKTVSIWQDKDNYNNKKEGLHTAILRIAIVVSLLVSLLASYYLTKCINL